MPAANPTLAFWEAAVVVLGFMGVWLVVGLALQAIINLFFKDGADADRAR